MTFPVVDATNISGESSTVSTHDISLPAGDLTGKLILIFFNHAGSGVTVTPPTDFDDLLPVGFSFQRVFGKIGDGSEGATVTASTSASRRSAHSSYAISGFFPSSDLTDIIEFSAEAGDNNPDPAGLAPSWGSADYLWITGLGSRRSDQTFTAPANYGSQIDSVSAAGSSSDQQCRQASARRNLTASSEDPAAWGVTGTLNAGRAWVAAIRPADSTPPPTPTFIGWGIPIS